MFNRTVGAKYKVFSIVKEKIDELDFFCLLSDPEIPRDEYDRESKEISMKLSLYSSKEEILKVITDVMSNSFSDDRYSQDLFLETAEKIYLEFEKIDSKDVLINIDKRFEDGNSF